MTNKEILEKAIQKAIDGGWEDGKEWLHDDELTFEANNYPEQIICNHDFAKALWGEDDKTCTPEHKSMGGTFNNAFEFTTIKKDWKYHLQQMVVSPDPIKYLGDNI